MSHFQSIPAGPPVGVGSMPNNASEADARSYSQNTINRGEISIKSASSTFEKSPGGDEISASLRRIAIELVALEGKTELALPAANSEASAAFGRITITEQASYSVSKENGALHIMADAGVTASLFESTVGLGLALNPKTIGDSVVDLYNKHLDPIADRLAGTDLPALSQLPDSWDHTLSLSAELTGGWGVAAQAQAELDLDSLGGKIAISASLSPTGIGAIVGAGIAVGIR